MYLKYTAIVYIALTNSRSARPELGYTEVIVSLFLRLSHQVLEAFVSFKDQLVFDEIARLLLVGYSGPFCTMW